MSYPRKAHDNYENHGEDAVATAPERVTLALALDNLEVALQQQQIAYMELCEHLSPVTGETPNAMNDMEFESEPGASKYVCDLRRATIMVVNMTNRLHILNSALEI